MFQTLINTEYKCNKCFFFFSFSFLFIKQQFAAFFLISRQGGSFLGNLFLNNHITWSSTTQWMHKRWQGLTKRLPDLLCSPIFDQPINLPIWSLHPGMPGTRPFCTAALIYAFIRRLPVRWLARILTKTIPSTLSRDMMWISWCRLHFPPLVFRLL